MKQFLASLILLITTGLIYAAPATISPGAIWPDNRGIHIEAHGGGIVRIGNTFYWFGQDFSQSNPPNTPVISCYSSTDLAHWQFRNQVEKASDPASLGTGWVLERPRVYYNSGTHKFVMYAHIDNANYTFADMAVFTCDTVDGNYQYLTCFRPLNKESRDIGQFIDDDGSAYIIFESRPTGGFYIAQLSADYLSVAKIIAFLYAPLEGGALIHYQGLYYVVGSHMTYWNPNPDAYATASKLAGPWTVFKDVAPPETNTYNSQSTHLLKVTGSAGTTVIFMGDMWEPNTQWDSRYMWMPLEIGGGKLLIPQPKNWTIDVTSGKAVISH